MIKEYLKNWRKLDNMAKIFSLADKKNNNIFRYSAILKHSVDGSILKEAVKMTIKNYPIFKVKTGTGLFWNYLVNNENEIIVKNEITSKFIHFEKNNSYLFKVTYFENKINLEMYHILTDGVGVTYFLKDILYNYLHLKYNINLPNDKKIIKNSIFTKDEYLKNANKKLKTKDEHKKAFLIEEQSEMFTNKTYHYILNLEKLKKTCKKNNVSITEYITALYIYAIYKILYNKLSNKDIIINVPIDLRKHYNVETLSNFFVCTSINGNIDTEKSVNFDKILREVHKEFESKITKENIEKYLSRDVKLGNNLGIRLVPLFFKKKVIKYFGKLLSGSSTTTLSNVGQVKIEEPFKKYIDNIVVTVNAGNIQKIKCTISSFENKLTITINSNLTSNKFEKEFYKLLKKYIGYVKLESNEL